MCIGARVLARPVAIVQETLIDVQTRDGAAIAGGALTHEGPGSVAAHLVTTSIVILKHVMRTLDLYSILYLTLINVLARVTIRSQRVARMTLALLPTS